MDSKDILSIWCEIWPIFWDEMELEGLLMQVLLQPPVLLHFKLNVYPNFPQSSGPPVK